MRLPTLALLFATAALAPAVAEMPLTEAERAAIHAEVRAYLIENPEILMEMVAILEGRQQTAQAEGDRALVAQHADAIFSDGYSFVGGNPEGSITIVEFVDYQCGFCRRAHPEVTAMLADDGDIRRVVKEFPILGPGSELAARAAVATLIAAGPESYERLNHALMGLDGPVTETSLDATMRTVGLDPATIRKGMQAPEVTRRLAETRDLAQALGIEGTPAFVVGTDMLRGYVPRAEIEAMVAALRAGD
jgi:protein-disulfide isomerase